MTNNDQTSTLPSTARVVIISGAIAGCTVVGTCRDSIDLAAGVGMEYIDAAEVNMRHPLINPQGLPGAWWDPLDGDIDPAGITFTMARCAREAGAKVSRFIPVHNITRETIGEFTAHTELGTVLCEKVVSAFIGKDPLQQKKLEDRKNTFVSLHLNCDTACAHGGPPVFAANQQIGTITSTAYGYRTSTNIAMGFVASEHNAIGTPLESGILGALYAAVIAAADCYDPQNTRLKT